MNAQPYEKPEISDYGDLQELTAACAPVTGKDGARNLASVFRDSDIVCITTPA